MADKKNSAAKGRVISTDELPELKQRAADLEQKLKTITDNHLQAGLRLLEERNRAQLYLDIAEVILVALDPAGTITLINRKGCRVLGFENEELTGKNWFETCLPPHMREQVFEVHKKLMKGEIQAVEYFENPVLTKNGEERLIAWHNALLRNEAGDIIGTLSSGEDITQRKEAEEKLKTSLKEKEVLLKEVHHRVKNNLAVISSLLNLQANAFNDPAVKGAFLDSQLRIRSMALIHEKLYQSKSLSDIDFSEYIKDLASRISRSNEFQKNRVSIKVNTDNIKMGIDSAIPCGLISNELLTNAFKYAFSPSQIGKIQIHMHLFQDNFYRLIISDNGVGLPAHIDVQSPTTFGLNLVLLLTQQLEGSIEVRRENGTTFTITFPVSLNQSTIVH